MDALIYAVRDGIRAAKIGYGAADTEIMDDGRPPPRCGNFFAAIHDGMMRSVADNQLNELYDFTVTLTMRVTVPLDRAGDQQISRNVLRALARKQGFYAKVDQLRALLHMNWGFVVMADQVPNSANDNMKAWADGGTVYGFCEPMRFRGMEFPKLVGGAWFGAEPEAEDVGIKSAMSFRDCKRFQPVMHPSGPFI